jgi:predicted NBD/HSP70 family sugar kinase
LLRHILNTSVSRSDIASLTGLTRAGAGVIVDSLIQNGFLEEKIVKTTGKGRYPKNLSIRDDAVYALGINITRTGFAVGICGLNGTIHAHKAFPVISWETRDEAIEFIYRQLDKLLKNSKKIDRNKIIGTGITTPGPIDSAKGVILTPPDFDHWEFCPIAEIYEKKIGIPAYLENNAIARTIEEQYYGLGKKYEDFITLVVENGIGGGVIINNELIKGVGGCGSELGHISINSRGKKCYCGNIGCLEMYANPKLYVAEARKAGYRVSGWNEIAAGADKGNRYFMELVKRMAGYLACGCTSLINLFEPQIIIVSGYISQNSAMLIKLINEKVNENRINRNIREIEIKSSNTNKSQGVMAAATLVFNRYLSSPIK